MADPATVRDRIADRTGRVLSDLREEWGTTATAEPVEYGPLPWYPEESPESVDEQLSAFAGIASVVVFYTADREETVLVYNPSGYWEPPGGAVEGREPLVETATREAREETGLDVEVTDLQYAGEVHYEYPEGTTIVLPVAQFVGHRVSRRLSVERETSDHPGVTRAVGLFDPDVLPEECRDRDRVASLLADAD